MRSLQQAQRINVGFDPENCLLATIDVGRAGYSQERGVSFQSRLLEDVRALPGVVAASFTAHPQLGPGYLGDGRVYVEGEAPMPDDRRPVVYLAAYMTTGLMAGFLYGINGRDPLTFVAAPMFLLLAAVVATVVPARQVSRVDPIVALRTE